jgi:hypothetical protein
LAAAPAAARGTIDPVVAGEAPGAGRGVGSGTFCASAGAAVRPASKAAISHLCPRRASWFAAITISAWALLLDLIWAGYGYFATP